MKRLALGISILAALSLASAAFGGTTIVGKYSTKLTGPAQFKGTWVISFAKGGTYTVAGNGQILVHGKYSTTGSKLTLGHETGPAACPKTGTYTWTRSGKTLRLKKASGSPPCSGRDLVLAHTFTKVG
jgi:hypothetical protein